MPKNKHAVALGRKGGKAGSKASKRRAALIRWGAKLKEGEKDK